MFDWISLSYVGIDSHAAIRFDPGVLAVAAKCRCSSF
jgi:hypothetical protein